MLSNTPEEGTMHPGSLVLAAQYLRMSNGNPAAFDVFAKRIAPQPNFLTGPPRFGATMSLPR